MKIPKVKRPCFVCNKIFLANKYHYLDSKSMSEALICPKHRADWLSGKTKDKNYKI